MSRIEYRVVHARAPWRKVRNHSSLMKAKYGPNGATSLLTGGLRQRIEKYGRVSCVMIWEHGMASGFILRLSPRTNDVEERTIPRDAVLRYELRGGIPTADIANWFEGVDAPAASSADQPPRAANRTRATAPGAKRTGRHAGIGSPKAPARLSVARLEEIGRIRLSPNFFLRDFLHQ